MTVHKTFISLCLAAIVCLTFATAASAAPAGDEYLPQLPESGAAATGAKADPSGKDSKGSDKQTAIVPTSDSGGSGGGSSGSILLNPLVLLMIAILIAAAVGVTLWRRNTDGGHDDDPAPPEPDATSAPPRTGPRTPDGKIIGPDQTG
jgi:hypothetical protein